MLAEIFIALILGIFCGTISGLLPGVHINLVALLLLSISAFLLEYASVLSLGCFIIAMAITHTFLDTLPSTFLGAADEESSLSLLPAQRLLLEGKGMDAVLLSLVGAFGGLLLALLCVPLFLLLVPVVYPFLEPFIGYLLLLLCIFMLWREKHTIFALLLFLLSGALGLAVFSLPLSQGLFPLFSGMFGVAMLVQGLQQKIVIPVQKSGNISLRDSVLAVPLAVFIGWIASFLPGLGPAQAAALGTSLMKMNEKAYLVLVGGLSTVNMLLSLITLYTLQKARNGAVVVLSQLMTLSKSDLFILLFVGLSAGSIATVLTLSFSQVFCKYMPKVSYKKISIAIVLFIGILVFLLCGWLGLLVLSVSTCVGLLPSQMHVARSHMMGALLIPVLMYFLL
ncbi:tripartite tricarboxylate transporter permease [Candidatus Woesearchaeota archaeon]|nr:tripartite tricarboxylate transporter permease [Candidatus Woesearchaeota archaeon]